MRFALFANGARAVNHHRRYLVWDHSNIDPEAVLPPDAADGPLLSYGYWITELGPTTRITGYHFYRRPFRWERREWPTLDPSEAEAERRSPSRALGFEDFPGLPFRRQNQVLRELQRAHDVYFGYRRPESMAPPPNASALARLNLLEAQVDEFLTDEFWGLKYAVTEDYCLYLRERSRLRHALRRWFPDRSRTGAG